MYIYIYVYICLLLHQYTPPSLSPLLSTFRLYLSKHPPSFSFLFGLMSGQGSGCVTQDIRLTWTHLRRTRKGMRRISHVKYRILLGWENSMAGLRPIVMQLTRNSTNQQPRYRSATPVHPRTAAAPSRSLPVQHRFRIPATPFFLFPFFSSLSLSSLSFTFTYPTPCYFPLRVIIPWDLSYQIPIPSSLFFPLLYHRTFFSTFFYSFTF